MLRVPASTCVGVLTALLPSLATAAHLKTLAISGVDSAVHGAATSAFTLTCMSCGRPDAVIHSGALCGDCAGDGQSPARHCKIADMKSGYLMCHGDDGTCDREVALSAESCWRALHSPANCSV